MTISFKKFAEFVALPSDPSDEQITEIFGLFQNNAKIEKLKKEREKIRKDTQKKVDAWKAKKELAASMNTSGADKDQQPANQTVSRSASGRAAERDWVSNMATESKEKDIHDVIFAFRSVYAHMDRLGFDFDDDHAQRRNIDWIIGSLKEGDIESAKRLISEFFSKADLFDTVLDEVFSILGIENLDQLYALIDTK